MLQFNDYVDITKESDVNKIVMSNNIIISVKRKLYKYKHENDYEHIEHIICIFFPMNFCLAMY